MTGITHKALVQEVASNKPNAATAFNLPDSATAPARSFDSALATGAVVPYHATNGTDWEDGIGTFTAGTPDTLTRNSILDSSTGSAIDFSAGADVVVRIVWPASIATEADLLMRSVVPGGRLSLAQSNPNYLIRHTLLPTTQDTSADTITVTGHGLVAGTIIRTVSAAGGGGLAAANKYYMGNITTGTFSLHSTLAAALAGTSKIDITGTVPALQCVGIAGTSIWYAPYKHNLINLWNGYRWQTIEFSETELAIGTVTANKVFDIFAYINAGVLELEKLEWTSDTVRATDVTLQDGRFCKSGDKTRLWIGSFYSVSTTETEISARRAYLINAYNKLRSTFDVRESAADWTYSTAAYRQVNANSENQVEFICPMNYWPIQILSKVRVSNSTATPREVVSFAGLDSTTVAVLGGTSFRLTPTNTIYQIGEGVILENSIPIGKHYVAAFEYGAGTDTQTWHGTNAFQALRGYIEA